MTTKICGICNTVKSVNDFNKCTRDGYDSRCKPCKFEYNKEWQTNNRDYVNERERNRTATNPQHQINKNMHSKLWSILKRGSYSLRTEQIIGLNKSTYLEWLSYNFEGEMCFATYGKVLETDLIIPASAYDLTTEDGLLACFNWKNIRPCLKSDNAAKYNFILAFAQANQSIRVLGFIRKLRQLKLVAFLNKFE